MNWFDSYEFGEWAMVKYPNFRVKRTPERKEEYLSDKKSGLFPARTSESIKKLRKNTKG